ncbi:MAG: RNA methyltransferase, partial [Pseudomonadota bacterium]|nr:RNA methyltransferase [Pseudomonadota bacterium]
RGANKNEYIRFIEFLEKTLDEKGFFYPVEKKNMMLNNIKAMFQRQNLTQKDIKILFGIFKHLIDE